MIYPGDTPGRKRSHLVRKRLLFSVATLAILGTLGFGALAWRPAIAPIAPLARGAFAPGLIATGATLAAGGYCAWPASRAESLDRSSGSAVWLVPVGQIMRAVALLKEFLRPTGTSMAS
jgi:hypothetical protein